jgi:hypothetical protein
MPTRAGQIRKHGSPPRRTSDPVFVPSEREPGRHSDARSTWKATSAGISGGKCHQARARNPLRP